MANPRYDQYGDQYGNMDQEGSFGRPYGQDDQNRSRESQGRSAQGYRGQGDQGYGPYAQGGPGHQGGQYGGQYGYGSQQGGSRGQESWSDRQARSDWNDDSGLYGGGYSGSRGSMGNGGEGDYPRRGGGAFRSAQTRGNWGDDQTGQGRGYGYGYGGADTQRTGGARQGYGYGYGGQNRGDDRGFFQRAGDEIASWFDDDRDSHRGKGPQGYSRSDSRIEDDVNDRLSDDPMVDASNIRVSVSGGEVTLEGEVDSKQAKRMAEDCVDRVSGVKHVQNNLRVKQTGSSVAGVSEAGTSGMAQQPGPHGVSTSSSTTGATSSLSSSAMGAR